MPTLCKSRGFWLLTRPMIIWSFTSTGVDQGPGILYDGHFPAKGEGLDFSVAHLELQMLSPALPSRSRALKGTVYYYAVYNGVLASSDIAADASALLADDDDSPKSE